MKQEIRTMLDEERGVSPVIGVILMVAITVILAAVIGTFVLGLGDSLQQAPNAQLNAESTSAGEITINHGGGDALPYSEITIRVNGVDHTSDFEDGEEFTVGQSISHSNSTGWAGDTETVQVIHNPSETILLDTEVDVQGTSS